jgi:hypothetical protein
LRRVLLKLANEVRWLWHKWHLYDELVAEIPQRLDAVPQLIGKRLGSLCWKQGANVASGWTGSV